MSRLAFVIDEDHPSGLISLGKRRTSIPLQEGFVERLEQWLEALQPTGHRTSRHVQSQEPPMAQQPLDATVTGELSQAGSPPTPRSPAIPWGLALVVAEP
jgi:hypothetical protein